MIKANTGDKLYIQAIEYVLQNGSEINPRGLKCTETLGTVLTLTNPQKSLITLKERYMAYKFCMAEKFCYLTGNGGENILPRYAKNISKFINPVTGKFDGAYGPRLIKQYDYILQLLKKDPDTRQAIMTVNNYHDDLHESLDIPCTLSLQLLKRQGKLNMIVTMRSNDLLWGFPYDISNFTFLQECFAAELGVEVGWYQHQVGSLHIYEKDIQIFHNILNNQETLPITQEKVPSLSFAELQREATAAINNRPTTSKYFTTAKRIFFN